MQKKQRETIGSILEIYIGNQYYVYAQILDKGYVFFDYYSTKKLKNFSVLETAPILFILSVYKSAVTKGKWLKVGKFPIRKEFENLPMKFVQDALNPALFSLYNPNNGAMIPAFRNDCEGLECAAVWEGEHVESRIQDHYNNTQNVWLEQLKIK